MMKIIQISDLHISRHSGELKHNCTPYELLVSVLDNINTSHSDLSGLVITGDLFSISLKTKGSFSFKPNPPVTNFLSRDIGFLRGF